MSNESHSNSIAIFDQFVATWESGEPLPFVEFLARHPSLSRASILTLVQEDQRRRWEQGDRRLIEEYIKELGSRIESDDVRLDLIYGEVLLREDFEEPVDEDDFANRFPDLVEPLMRQIRFHSALMKADPTIVEKPTSDATIQAPRGQGPTGANPRRPREAFGALKSLTESAPTIPGYEILAYAGRGASAVVYRARDEVLKRIVAIKLLPVRTDQTDVREQLLAEARAAAQIPHPNIVQVFEIGECADGCYLVMEYMDGGSLADRLSAGILEPKEGAKILAQVARAVQAAHEQGIIHRDLKPQNILFDLLGTPKVSDFGLARTIETDTSLAATENIVGTPQYMAPEQARTGPGSISRRADIYSLGAILYCSLAGRPPHQAGTVWATIEQVLSADPVSLRRLNPETPIDLETICHRAIHRDSDRRYRSAVEFAEELERWREGKPILARPISRTERVVRWCKRNPRLSLMSIGVVLLLLTVVFGTSLFTIQLATVNHALVQQQKESLEARIETVLRAQPAALNLAIENVSDSDNALEILQREFEDSSDTSTRLNSALAVGRLGEPDWDYLLKAVQTTHLDPGRCQNFVKAFDAHRDEAVPALIQELADTQPQQVKQTNTPDQPNSGLRIIDRELAAKQLRILIILLHLGEFAPAEQWLNQPLAIGSAADSEDRISRIAMFVAVFRDWQADLSWVGELSIGPETQSTRIAVGQALGESDSDLWPVQQYESVVNAITKWYQIGEDGGSHSVAEWALRRWHRLPESNLSDSNSKTGREGWFIEQAGMTLVRVPSGRFRMMYVNVDAATNPQQEENKSLPPMVTISHPYFISSTEVTRGLYERFQSERKAVDTVSDADGVADQASVQPQLFLDQYISPSPNRPVQGVRWVDAILFCNWLSELNEREPCYHFNGTLEDGKWECNFDANGFRLPTEAEWEHACRAGAETRYSFGNDQTLLPQFARTSNFRRVATLPVGTLRPNRWGLFDAHGNVWEWCWDYFDTLPTEPRINPQGPESPPENFGSARIYRGGGVGNFSGDPDATARGYTGPGNFAWNLGFRVVTNEAGSRE